MNISKLALISIATVAAASPAYAATMFDFEGVALGTYQSALVVNDGALALTITPEGSPAGSLTIENSGVALIGKGIAGNRGTTQALRGFAPLRFSFSQVLDSITFNFGDLGGDADDPVTISAYSLGGNLLGTSTGAYPADKRDGASLTLNYAGASYYLASSGSTIGNNNSLFYDISAYSLSAPAVPEPATWAMMILGMGAVGFAMRRRRSNVTTTVAFV